MEKRDIVSCQWPGGLSSIAGGTRGGIKLSRPWQQMIIPNTETCPFCTGKGKILKSFVGGEWLLLQNHFTPYPYHRMIIPKSCWNDNELRSLGGHERLRQALQLAVEEIRSSEEGRIFVNVHVGSLAGQNINHLHYHIVKYNVGTNVEQSRVPAEMHDFFSQRRNLIVVQTNRSYVGIGGIRACQGFVLSHHTPSVEEIAEILSKLISLVNKKFESKQGLSPDFALCLSFEHGEFCYGLYTPTLNQWGAAEYAALYEPGCPISLPWPHEVTAAFLRQS